jgi:glyoxylase-like metal-dependent hydrolase (beta-lactamase superfamily II)
MREIAPGLFHWKAMHPRIRSEVSSYFVADSGTLLDPMVPPDAGLEWFTGARSPQAIALTNRHHDRECERFCAEFDVAPVLVPEPGLHEFERKSLDVTGYAAGEEIAPGILAHSVGAICPDDMALEIRSAGAVALADSVINEGGGLTFVPDHCMDEPEQTKVRLAESLEQLLDLDFDTLLFAHGDPVVGGGKQALRDFLASRPAG